MGEKTHTLQINFELPYNETQINTAILTVEVMKTKTKTHKIKGS